MGPEVLPGLPDVAPVQLSPFVPVTVLDETFEMLQYSRLHDGRPSGVLASTPGPHEREIDLSAEGVGCRVSAP
jgi:hypothetical protein